MQLNPDYHVARYRIFLDATCFEEDGALAVVRGELGSIAHRTRRPLILGATGVVRLGATASPDTLQAVRGLCDDGVLQIMGHPGEVDGDAELLGMVECRPDGYGLMVVTQRRDFADALRRALPPSKNFVVARFHDGALHAWPGATRSGPAQARAPSAPARFAQIGRMVATPPRPVGAPTIPIEGARLVVAGVESVRLAERVAGGGEATIHALDGPGRVAKVYLPGKLTDHTLAKIELMSVVRIADSALCWPEALLRDERGEPVGYVMRRAEGRPLKRSIFIRPALQQHFPNWNRLDLVKVAINVAAAVDRLHMMNVVLGDINAENILVRADGAVSLVDLDSVQIEGYPCPVGMPDFTRAANQGRPFNSYLRTVEDDRFALAVMLFMILMPGKHPFAHRGGEGVAHNIRAGLFPYPIYGRSAPGTDGKHVPDGPWRNIWSHLNKKVRLAFYECFAEGRLRSARDWNFIARDYARSIGDGFMSSDGGNDIFPERPRSFTKEEQRELGITQAERREFTCGTCGNPFQVTLESLSRHSTPIDCGDCRKAKRLNAERLRSAAGAHRPAAPRVSARMPPPRAKPGPPSSPPPGSSGFIAGLINLLLGRS